MTVGHECCVVIAVLEFLMGEQNIVQSKSLIKLILVGLLTLVVIVGGYFLRLIFRMIAR